jgi:putative ABC transport system permease protein
MRDLAADVRFALRGFRRNPGFTAVVVAVLGLGIGANTAIFSVVDALVLRPLPFPDADRLVTLHTRNLSLDRLGPVSWPDVADVRAQSRALGELAVYRPYRFVLVGQGEPETLDGIVASAELFSVLGRPPALGRGFLPGEDRAGQAPVVVLSHAFWQRRLAADPAAIGRALTLNGTRFTVVGVAHPGFRFPLEDPAPAFWVTLHGSFDEDARQWRSMMPYRSGIARLRPGVSVAQAQADLDLIHARLAAAYPKDDGGRVFVVSSFHDEWIREGRGSLLILLGAVGLVLLIACANVANLQLARVAARRREIAIRTALGAGRGRIARQFLAESLLLAALGCGVGLAVSWLGLDVLVAAIPGELARPHPVALDGRVLAYALVLALVTGLLVGSVPAALAMRADLRGALADASGTVVAGRGRIRSALLVLEVALALIVVVGAGLLVRSFARVAAIDPGFQQRSLLTARLRLSGTPIDRPRLYRGLLERLPALPGARAAAVAQPLPFTRWGGKWQFTLDDRPAPAADAPLLSEVRSVSPGYFHTLGIPLIDGRLFEAADDTREAPQVAVVNQTFARQFWPQGSPLGRRILAYGRYNPRIVGVVADSRGTCRVAGCAGEDQARLERPAEPEAFIPLKGAGGLELYVAVRVDQPMAAAGSLRALIRDIDPNLPVDQIRTMEDAIGESLAQRRLNLTLLALWAGLALLLAVIGVYAVLSYSVVQRRREVAIRMALGAQGRQVRRLLMVQGLRLTALGLVLGVLGALGLTRVLRSQLYGVSATDPLTFVAVIVLLVLVAALACLLPARRATRIDPMIALRGE